LILNPNAALLRTDRGGLLLWCGLTAALLLTGCGQSTSSYKPPRVENGGEGLSLLSPVLIDGLRVPERYKCKRYAIWLPIEWSNVPKGSAELILAVTFNKIVHKKNGAVESTLVSQAIVAGLSPDLRRLNVGPPPDGSFIKHHYAGGYCPPQNRESGLLFSLYAMPPGHRPKRFEAIGLSTIKALEKGAVASGSLPAFYGAAGS
jgi:phosphatidylethanolamine-binding protein (PEBP) family uncharacterized protein